MTKASAGKSLTDYTQFLNKDGLRGARLGVARKYFGFNDAVDKLLNDQITEMKRMGAVIVDPADIPTADAIFSDLAELIVLIYEFKRDLNAYLATRTGIPVRQLTPRSPRSRAPSQRAYCTWIGWSSPKNVLSARIDSSLYAPSVPTIWSTTVPGIRRTSRKTATLTPNSAGTIDRIRAATYQRTTARALRPSHHE